MSWKFNCFPRIDDALMDSFVYGFQYMNKRKGDIGMRTEDVKKGKVVYFNSDIGEKDNYYPPYGTVGVLDESNDEDPFVVWREWTCPLNPVRSAVYAKYLTEATIEPGDTVRIIDNGKERPVGRVNGERIYLLYGDPPMIEGPGTFSASDLDLVRKAKKPVDLPKPCEEFRNMMRSSFETLKQKEKEERTMFKAGDRVVPFQKTAFDDFETWKLRNPGEAKFLEINGYLPVENVWESQEKISLWSGTGEQGNSVFRYTDVRPLVSRIALVRHDAPKSFLFAVPDGLDVHKGDRVICDTCKGDQKGTIEHGPEEVTPELLTMIADGCGATLPLRNVLRKVEEYKKGDWIEWIGMAEKDLPIGFRATVLEAYPPRVCFKDAAGDRRTKNAREVRPCSPPSSIILTAEQVKRELREKYGNHIVVEFNGQKMEL